MTAADLAVKLSDLAVEYQDITVRVAADGPAETEERAARLRDMGEIVRVGDRTADVLGVARVDWAAIRLLAGLDS